MRWEQFRGLGPAPKGFQTPVISSSWLVRILKLQREKNQHVEHNQQHQGS
jgi:hypothetical protein